MGGRMKELEVENFKSYKGKQRIGPFHRFTAIIGPNGSGKSNLMDAICFVLGEKTSNLRVRKVGDLIHGAPIGKPVSTRCHVTLFYEHDDGGEKVFTRTVAGSSSEYRIDGKVVPAASYTQEFESIGIYIKAKNFLVYQGQVDQIALKNPKERTGLFEEISRSNELKEEYDKAKTEMQKADEDTQYNYNRRKNIAQEKKEAKQEKEEAEKYQKLKDELVGKQLQLHLFKLFHNEREIKTLKEELTTKQKSVEEIREDKGKADEEVKEKLREQKKVAKELTKLEQEIQHLEVDIGKMRPNWIKAKEQLKHQEKRLEGQKRVLNSASKTADEQAIQLSELETQIAELKAQRDDYEDKLNQESQELQLEFNEAQVQEYYELARESGKQCSKIQAELDGLDQEQQVDKAQVDNDKRRKGEFTGRLKRKQTEMEEAVNRIDHLKEKIEKLTAQLNDDQHKLKDTDGEVRVNCKRMEEVTLEMNQINQQLAEARVDTHESSRAQKRQELLETLKRMHPGSVYGRLVDLCQPTHKRYQLAVTKVLGKNMMAIVVDNEQTARSCITYIKEQRGEPETFLPAAYIDVRPINEQLREIRDPKDVKLVIDVIKVELPQAKKALQFACTNALVCETPEDARKLAFGGRLRHKAVSLDGTLFQKSGIISGGASELKAKARRWDEKHVNQLRSQREKLSEEQRELHRKRNMEHQVPTLQANIKSLDQRIKFVKQDLHNQKNDVISQLEIDLETLKSEEVALEPRIKKIEERIGKRQSQMEEIEKRRNRVRDQVFADFCSRVGINNIRVYEDRELRFHNEKKDKLRNFDNQLDRLQHEWEFLKSEDKAVAQKKAESMVKKLEQELEDLNREELDQRKLCEQQILKMDEKKTERVEKKAELTDKEAETNEARKAMGVFLKQLNNIEKQLSAMETRIHQKKADRHSLLLACKMTSIDLPLSKGTMEDIGNEELESQESLGVASTSEEGGQSSQSLESRRVLDREAKIKINYRSLDSDLKDMEGEEELRKALDKLKKETNEMTQHLDRIAAPNLKAGQRLDVVRGQEAETVNEFDKSRKKARKARIAFEKVKQNRLDRFNGCFEQVASKIDEIYKLLSRSQSAQAYLGPDNAEEPYLEGVSFNCVAPGKRYRPMDNLSGGEKTVAALALLFAIHASQPSPFFVLDEIDAALDNTNIGKVASFIREQSESNMQVIVISLKEEFYHRADALIGIYPRPGPCTVSGVLSLDLTKYRDPQGETQ